MIWRAEAVAGSPVGQREEVSEAEYLTSSVSKTEEAFAFVLWHCRSPFGESLSDFVDGLGAAMGAPL